MRKYIFIVDPKGHILKSDSVFNRHLEYARGLNQASRGQINLGILRPTLWRFAEKSHENLLVIDFPILKFLFPKVLGNISKFTEEKIPSLLIAGDPWLAGILAVLVSRKLQVRTNIQIQFHGDFGNPAWIRESLKNRIKFKVAKLVVKEANHVRCVSDAQEILISKIFKLDTTKLLVAPVPMMLWKQTLTGHKTFSTIPRLGLVGRIHHDRGLQTFVDLVEKLVAENREFSIHIVGSGPQRTWLEQKCKESFPNIHIEFFGEVESLNMKMCWENLDLLISCAPTESYGRAAREALFFGVPVLATPSSGINSLTEANQLGYLEYFESYFESQHLAEAFDRLLKKTISLDFRKRIASNDEENFNSIIEEWIVLANFISKN